MEDTKHIDTYLQPRKNPTENMDTLFLLEVNGVCPRCGKPLLGTKGTRSHKYYQIAHIYPNSPLESEVEELNGLPRLGNNCEDAANKIALCKDCHGYYDDHKTKAEYLWFVQKKQELLANSTLKQAGYNFSLESEIAKAIEQLSRIPAGSLRDLTYKGVLLANKIPEKEMLLKTKVFAYVVTYFLFVQETFFQLNTTGQLNFNLIASEVNTFFLKCEAESVTLNQIFHAIVNWIKEKSGSDSIEACEAIVAFFIQDCEVFHEIS